MASASDDGTVHIFHSTVYRLDNHCSNRSVLTPSFLLM
jgi:hypothetical protein